MAFITLAFNVQGNNAIIEQATVTPTPIVDLTPTPAATVVPDNGIQQTQYGYVITYPEAVKSSDINVNPNPDYVAPQSQATPTPTVMPSATPKPSPTRRPVPTIRPRTTITTVP